MQIAYDVMINFDCGIYTITSPSGKQYIGSAVSFKGRWRTHLHRLRKGVHHNPGLQRAFLKYGEDALVFAKIAFVPRHELIAREQEQIDVRGYKNLYNASPFAGSALGRLASAETRKRLSKSLRGRVFTDEHRAKIGRAQKGRVRTPETLARMSKARTGYPGFAHTPESKAKMAKNQTGRKTAANKSGFCGVYQIPSGKWAAQWRVARVRHYLGTYDSPEAANAVVEEFKRTGKRPPPQALQSNNVSGFKGVSAYGEKWQASVRHEGRRYHLGTFDSPEAANEAIMRYKANMEQ